MSRLNPKVPENAKKVFEGKLFDVYQWEQELYNGKTTIFEKLARADTALVLPITTDKKIILSKQQQPGHDTYISLIGGRVEGSESIEQAVVREMEEETGYTSSELSLFINSSPIMKMDWEVRVYIAKNCTKVHEQKLDGGEKIELIFLTFDELIDFAITGKLSKEPELELELLKAKASDQKMQELKAKLFD